MAIMAVLAMAMIAMIAMGRAGCTSTRASDRACDSCLAHRLLRSDHCLPNCLPACLTAFLTRPCFAIFSLPLSLSFSAAARGMDWILCIHYSSFIMAVVLVSAFFVVAVITTACDMAHGHHGAD